MKKLVTPFFRAGVFSFFLFIFFGSLAFALPSAPVFSSVTLEGKPVSSSQLAGKVYIVNFFASWCPPCRAEIPDMVTLQTKYGRKGFTFIGVAVNETESSMRSFVKKYKINYPVIMVDDKIIGAFNTLVDGGVQAIPTSFVVSSSGKVTQVFTGARSKEVLEQLILQALTKPIVSK
ncbi:MAG: TlpA family protein disulfide reductase [Chlorobium sp.]|nr:MAG: TlpA family protein disulfide reductase [Chlorobium sp.]